MEDNDHFRKAPPNTNNNKTSPLKILSFSINKLESVFSEENKCYSNDATGDMDSPKINVECTFWQPHGYQSVIKINGKPILPPLMTEDRRREMQELKCQAIRVEARIRAQQRQKLINRVENVLDTFDLQRSLKEQDLVLEDYADHEVVKEATNLQSLEAEDLVKKDIKEMASGVEVAKALNTKVYAKEDSGIDSQNTVSVETTLSGAHNESANVSVNPDSILGVESIPSNSNSPKSAISVNDSSPARTAESASDIQGVVDLEIVQLGGEVLAADLGNINDRHDMTDGSIKSETSQEVSYNGETSISTKLTSDCDTDDRQPEIFNIEVELHPLSTSEPSTESDVESRERSLLVEGMSLMEHDDTEKHQPKLKSNPQSTLTSSTLGSSLLSRVDLAVASDADEDDDSDIDYFSLPPDNDNRQDVINMVERQTLKSTKPNYQNHPSPEPSYTSPLLSNASPNSNHNTSFKSDIRSAIDFEADDEYSVGVDTTGSCITSSSATVNTDRYLKILTGSESCREVSLEPVISTDVEAFTTHSSGSSPAAAKSHGVAAVKSDGLVSVPEQQQDLKQNLPVPIHAGVEKKAEQIEDPRGTLVRQGSYTLEKPSPALVIAKSSAETKNSNIPQITSRGQSPEAPLFKLTSSMEDLKLKSVQRKLTFEKNKENCNPDTSLASMDSEKDGKKAHLSRYLENIGQMPGVKGLNPKKKKIQPSSKSKASYTQKPAAAIDQSIAGSALADSFHRSVQELQSNYSATSPVQSNVLPTNFNLSSEDSMPLVSENFELPELPVEDLIQAQSDYFEQQKKQLIKEQQQQLQTMFVEQQRQQALFKNEIMKLSQNQSEENSFNLPQNVSSHQAGPNVHHSFPVETQLTTQQEVWCGMMLAESLPTDLLQNFSAEELSCVLSNTLNSFNADSQLVSDSDTVKCSLQSAKSPLPAVPKMITKSPSAEFMNRMSIYASQDVLENEQLEVLSNRFYSGIGNRSMLGPNAKEAIPERVYASSPQNSYSTRRQTPSKQVKTAWPTGKLHQQNQAAISEWERGLSEQQQLSFKKLSAVAKGFLTRRLFASDKVKHLIHTVEDTAEFAMNFQNDMVSKEGHYTDQDRFLNDRIIAQLNGALFDIHEIFFELPVEERMTLIAQTRERKRNEIFKLKKEAEAKGKLSAATVKALDRRRKAKSEGSVVHKANIIQNRPGPRDKNFNSSIRIRKVAQPQGRKSLERISGLRTDVSNGYPMKILKEPYGPSRPTTTAFKNVAAKGGTKIRRTIAGPVHKINSSKPKRTIAPTRHKPDSSDRK